MIERKRICDLCLDKEIHCEQPEGMIDKRLIYNPWRDCFVDWLDIQHCPQRMWLLGECL